MFSASGLPETLANTVRVDYSYFIDEKPHQVPPIPGHNCNPVFDHKHNFVQDPVTSRFLEYLQSKLVFRVYGRDSSAQAIADGQAASRREAEALAVPQVWHVPEVQMVEPEPALASPDQYEQDEQQRQQQQQQQQRQPSMEVSATATSPVEATSPEATEKNAAPPASQQRTSTPSQASRRVQEASDAASRGELSRTSAEGGGQQQSKACTIL